MKLITEDVRGYTSAKYLSEHITALGFKKTKQCNKLKEPFSDYPVIIVDKSKIPEKCERLIPCQTVSGLSLIHI